MTFSHEAMATTFEISIAGTTESYARQAAGAAWRELDRLEGELSRFIESSDIARASRLARGESIAIGDDATQCLRLAAEWSAATARAFDPAYASQRGAEDAPDEPLFALDVAAHTLTSLTEKLQLDLGAVGKGYALDRLADVLSEWDIATACLQSGGSSVLALAPPPDASGWPIGVGEGAARVVVPLAHRSLSGSGIAVKGRHLIDPRTGQPAPRTTRVWSFAHTAAAADALSTAFFILTDAEIAAFCATHPDLGAVIAHSDGSLAWHGTGRSLRA